MFRRRWLLNVLAGMAAGCVEPPAPPPDAGVRMSLALAIGLLEAKDYAGFVERFVPPAELEKERGAGRTLDDIAGHLLIEPDQLLARLRLVRGVSPTFHDGGTTAVFESVHQNRPVRFAFRRIDGKWYLK